MWSHQEAHPGEVLRVRFLEPLGLSASALATACHVPRSRVADLLSGKRGISADTAKRLGALFRMEPEFWMALQAEWELHRAVPDPKVVPLDPPGFLLGPLGATPLPSRRPGRPVVWVSAPSVHEATAGHRETHRHDEVCYPDGTRAMVARPL
jgi:addiction module HigA family antidote